MSAFKTVPYAMAAMLVAGAALAQPAQPTGAGTPAAGQATTGQMPASEAPATQAPAGTAQATQPRPAHKAMPRVAATISGKVDALFGRQIVIAADDGSKVLVDLGRHAPFKPALTVGESVKVAGEMEHNHRLEARELTRANGTAVPLGNARHAEGKRHWHHEHAAAAPANGSATTGTN
ncbi:MAG: hypothetical protein J0H67_07675 [Rhodospirillales bacterium]|nr:hypothetical protein [Rhodospirillales bacterium]MBN8897127.1 hypothetical protein [Rhodospirillales bacterium]